MSDVESLTLLVATMVLTAAVLAVGFLEAAGRLPRELCAPVEPTTDTESTVVSSAPSHDREGAIR